MENKEKHIIDRINNHREMVDTSDLWANIEGEIGAPKKKRRPLLWFWFGMFSLMLLGLVWQYQNTQKIPFSQDLNTLENKSENHKETISSNLVEDKNTMLVIESGESIDLQETISTDQNSNKKVDNQSRQSVDTKNRIGHDFSKTEVSNSTVSQVSKNQFGAEKISEIVREKRKVPAKSPSYKTAIGIPVHPEPVMGLEPSITNDKNNLLYDIPYLELIKSKVIFERQHIDKRPIVSLPSTEVDQEEDKKEKKKWAVGIAGGYLNSTRKLTTLSSELVEQRLYRESIEKSIGGFDLSASLTYRNGKWRIGSGVSYMSLVDLAEFQSSNVRQKDGDDATVYYLDGSTNSIPTQNFVEETWRHKRYNTARFISIPLSVSYQFLTVGNIDFSLGVEGRYNIGFGYKGLTGETTESLYDLTTDVDNRYKKNGVHQYGLNLMTAYPFSSSTVGMLSLGYAKTNRINTKNYLIDQQYNLINLTAGIQWLF